MTKYIKWCLIIMPWVFFPMGKVLDPFRLPKEVFFDIVCLGIILIAIKNGLRVIYSNFYLFLFSLWVFFTIFMNWYLPIMCSTIHGTIYNLGTIQASIHFILGITASFLALSYLKKDDFIVFAKALCGTSVVLVFFGIMQIIGFDPVGKLVVRYNHPNHFYGLLDNPNTMANYIVLITPLFLMFKEFRYKLGMAICLLGLYFANSKLAWIALGIGLYVFLLVNNLNKRWRLLALLSLIPAIVFTGWKFLHAQILLNGLDYRIPAWKMALEHIKTNPLFGSGLGIFPQWRINFNASHWTNMHCDWGERVVEIGVLGLVLFLLVIFRSLKNFNYSKDNRVGISYLSSFTVLSVLMCGTFVVETAATALTGLVILWAVEKGE